MPSTPPPAASQGLLFEEDYLIRSVGEVGKRPEVALSELIANAWDAGATSVRIVIPDTHGETLSVEDDGSGLTREQFHDRWMRLGYRRAKRQGRYAELPPGRDHLAARRAFGRNGIGRHGLFCFGDEYEVVTRRDGQVSTFRVHLTSGHDPYAIAKESSEPGQGNGTTLRVSVERHLPDADRIRDILASRFVLDPAFQISVNGVSLPLTDLPGVVGRKTLTLSDGQSIEVICIEGDPGKGKTKHQSGVAFWVGGRLVGEPGWHIGFERILDGRTRAGQRLAFIARSNDLHDEVLPDWSGFRESPLVEELRETVSAHVRDVLKTIMAEHRAETTEDALREHVDELEQLDPSARAEVAELAERIVEANPLLNVATISAVVEGAVRLKKSAAVEQLIQRVMTLSEEDVEGMNRLLDEWTVRDARTVLDEVSRRIKVVEAIEKLSGKSATDELHVLHPLVTQARWLFGPEFESALYASNLSIKNAVQTVFQTKVEAGSFIDAKKRPDLLFLKDATLSAVAAEDFDVGTGMARLRTVLLIELKRGETTIGREEMNQADGYVQDILACGQLGATPYVYAYVVGHTVDSRMKTVRKVGDPECARVEAITFAQLVRTANFRLFRIRERVGERYPETADALIAKLRAQPADTGTMPLFPPAAEAQA